MMKHRTSLVMVALAGFVATGCAAETGDENRSEGAFTTPVATSNEVEPGSFKLYDNPDYEASPTCDVHTALVLDNDPRGPVAKLSEGLIGYCEIYVEANERSYRLELVDSECGSLIYVGTTRKNGRKLEITVTDHRFRTCSDAVPSEIVVEESGVTREEGKPFVKYSADVESERAEEKK